MKLRNVVHIDMPNVIALFLYHRLVNMSGLKEDLYYMSPHVRRHHIFVGVTARSQLRQQGQSNIWCSDRLPKTSSSQASAFHYPRPIPALPTGRQKDHGVTLAYSVESSIPQDCYFRHLEHVQNVQKVLCTNFRR